MLFAALSSFLQFGINAIAATLNLLFSFFPASPFKILSNSQFTDLLAQINFFIPIYEFAAIIEAWLVCVAAYYVYSIWARWVKAIE